MGLVYLNIWCNSCGSNNVISKYEESNNEIYCACMDCYNADSMKNFDYLLEGDVCDEE